MQKWFILSVVFVSGLLLVTLLKAQEGSGGESGDIDIANVIELRKAAIRKAEDDLKNEKLSPEDRLEAAQKLSRFRSSGSIPILLGYLTIQESFVEESEPRTYISCYPVAEALLRFGMNVVPHILNRVSSGTVPEKNKLENVLMASICQKVMGAETLEKYIAKWITDKPERKPESLTGLISRVKHLEQGYKMRRK